MRRGHIVLLRAFIINMQTNSLEQEVFIDGSGKGPENVIVPKSGRLGKVVRMEGEHPSVPVTEELDMRIILPPDIREGTYLLHVAPAAPSF